MAKSPSRRRLILTLTTLLVGVGIGIGVWIVRYFPSEEASGLTDVPALPLPPVSQPLPIIVNTPVAIVGTSLFIPNIGVNAPILESRLHPDGWQVDHLADQVGHLEATRWVGQGGNIVLAGHVENAEGEPSVFADLDQLNPNDLIVLTDQNMEYHYRVQAIREVNADDMSVVYDTSQEQLTLITCSAYSFLSATYEKRLVVVALRVY